MEEEIEVRTPRSGGEQRTVCVHDSKMVQTNELWRGRVTADSHTSAEWYLYGGCNVMVVTTF
jgi:hypothetical protein